MSSSQSDQQDFTADEPEPLDGYLPTSKFAVVSLVLGLLSMVALLPTLLTAGLTTLLAFVCLAGWLHTRRWKEEVSGQRLALFGLMLAVGFSTAGFVRYATYRTLLENSADAAAAQFLKYLREGQPQLAHQMMQNPRRRASGSVPIWEHYRQDAAQRAELREFVEEPAVRLLLELGEQAQTRLYEIVWEDSRPSYEQFSVFYAITLEQEGRKTSFFVYLPMRFWNEEHVWEVEQASGGVYPPSYPAAGTATR